MNPKKTITQKSRGSREAHVRRGNTIVLVTGILVLFVIIATAYVTRTQAGRTTAVATQSTELRDDGARNIAEFLAGEIAGQLFVRPIDSTIVPPGTIANSNVPRLPQFADAVRYGQDIQDVDNDGTADTFYPYNHAPFHVAAYTNPPDATGDPALNAKLPQGPGNPTGGTFSPFLASEGNPIGYPGFGDNRPLRSTEPNRYQDDFDNDGVIEPGEIAYSHWPHLTNISRAENGYRIVSDISDVGDSNGDKLGLLVDDLKIPVEQWPHILPLYVEDGGTGEGTDGDTVYKPADFWADWTQWLGIIAPTPTVILYASAYVDPARLPANFYRLSNLDGDSVFHENGERPQDEFVGPSSAWPKGSPRWNVGRVLADTDGDNYTDSFWFLAPVTIENGIRRIVAVSIVDNCAMLNANVATRYMRSGFFDRTRGLTPADLALVGGLDAFFGINNWNVGFYENPDHDCNLNPPTFKPFDYFIDSTGANTRWWRHVGETGLAGGNPATLDLSQDDRMDYWRKAASRPLSASLDAGYTPFTLADEIELRMHHGQNYISVFSRFEWSVQDFNDGPGGSFLRANVETGFAESSEYSQNAVNIPDQLQNRMLVMDRRKQLTLYSAARNDLMPPWLWANPNVPQKKLDLRRLDMVVDANDENNNGTDDEQADLRLHLRNFVMRALADDPFGATPVGSSYYGSGANNVVKTWPLAAAFAANILQNRDYDDGFQDVYPLGSPDGLDDEPSPLAEVVPVYTTTPAVPGVPKPAMMGMEKQPFLVEAFIAHVYKAVIAEFDHAAQQIVAGDAVLCGGDDHHSTIVVVQIANPYDADLDLTGFKLKLIADLDFALADREIDLGVVVGTGNSILPAGQARTYFAFAADFNTNVSSIVKWRDEILNLDASFANAIPVPLTATNLVPEWSTDRDDYDGEEEKRAVEIVRIDNSTGASAEIVVDRIDVHAADTTDDDFAFGEAVTEMQAPHDPVDCTEPPDGVDWTGATFSPNTHWAQWVHVTRAWDINQDGVATTIGATERNPRFIFADRAVTTTFAAGRGYNDAEPSNLWFVDTSTPPQPIPVARFDTAIKGVSGGVYAGEGDLDFPLQMLQKDGDYQQAGELLNVWLYGHELKVDFSASPIDLVEIEIDPNNPPGTVDSDAGTRTTFSEFIGKGVTTGSDYLALVGRDIRVNRLRLEPTDTDGDATEDAGFVIAVDDPNPLVTADDYLRAYPALPAGVRLLDAFVCDGTGIDPLTDLNGDGSVDQQDAELRRFANAGNFTGAGTAGMINIGTAYTEVMRSNPHWYRLVHETGESFATTPATLYANLPNDPPLVAPVAFNADMRLPRVMLPEAIEQYRSRYGTYADPGPTRTGHVYGADYLDRGTPNTGYIPDMRGDRGIASIGEVALLMKPGVLPPPPPAGEDFIEPQSWRIDFGATPDPANPGSTFYPFLNAAGGQPVSQRISTDVNDLPDSTIDSDTDPDPDFVAGDVEEANILFTGASNLITTRSDTFTVYFRVRSFRQNTSVFPARWDATDPAYIIDDSRYVMLVDRSNVNKPTDKPRILYLEKLPN